ncbi:MAG: aldehyde dehydrogenase family protein, partial [Snowella sp.]
MAIATINPTTGEIIQTFTAHSPETVNAKLALAQKAFENYRNLPFSQRGQW